MSPWLLCVLLLGAVCVESSPQCVAPPTWTSRAVARLGLDNAVAYADVLALGELVPHAYDAVLDAVASHAASATVDGAFFPWHALLDYFDCEALRAPFDCHAQAEWIQYFGAQVLATCGHQWTTQLAHVVPDADPDPDRPHAECVPGPEPGMGWCETEHPTHLNGLCGGNPSLLKCFELPVNSRVHPQRTAEATDYKFTCACLSS